MWGRINFIIACATFTNLGIVTLFVWLYPNVTVFQITTTLAWILIAIQLLAGNKLKKK